MTVLMENHETLFVVGQYPNYPESNKWELQGVYSTREAAVANSQPGWFIGEIPLNTPGPVETVEWEVEYQ